MLATSHAAALSGNLAYLAEELAARRPAIPVTVLAFRRGAGVVGRLRAIVARRSSRLPPGRRARLRRRRLLLPDLRDHAAPGDGPAPGLARGRRVQEVRLQRARPVVRRRRGVRRAGARSTPTTASRWCRRCRSRRTTRRRSGSRSSCSRRASGCRARTCSPTRPGGTAPLARLRATYGLPDGRRIVLYAPDVPRRHRRQGPLRRPARPARHARRPGRRPRRRCSSSTRSSATRSTIPPELAAFAIDASADPDLNELMLVSRRPGDRLLERDLRVRAARPADRVPRPRRRRVRATSAASTSTSRRTCRGRCSTTTDELAAAIRADAFDLERGPGVRGGVVRRGRRPRDRADRGRGASCPALRGEPPRDRLGRAPERGAAPPRPPRSCAAASRPTRRTPRRARARRRAAPPRMIPPTSSATISPARSKSSTRAGEVLRSSTPICSISVGQRRSGRRRSVARLSRQAAGHALERAAAGR